LKEEIKMGNLDNKTIFITGASSGFGEAIALSCAKQGANVVLVARRKDALEAVATAARELGAKALVCPTDVTDDGQIHTAIQAAHDEFGQIDVLVNNAGTNVTQRTIADTSVEQWQKLIDVNLTSAFVFTKAILPEMKERGVGLIINLSSRSGLFPGIGGGVAYSTSKIGMEALNTITNQEGNPFGVRACLFCPGSGNTPILDIRPKASSEEQRMKMLQPEDIGDTVAFIAGLPPRVNIDLISMTPTRL